MKNKTIFITGGNDGIGKVTAELFSSLGANVAIMGRRPDKNASAKADIEAKGGKCITFGGDIAVLADVEHALAQTFETFGSLHYAFNNGGTAEIPKPFTKGSDEEYYALTDTHIKGTWQCMKNQIPYIIQSGGGAIVNNSSAAGHVGQLMMPLYSACKHAMLGLTKSVALEYAQQGVRINAVCPGPVGTPNYENSAALTPALKASIEGSVPMGRVASCEEVASAVLFLCRDATSTTGSSLMVDGGYAAQ
jgi:NAD(P)-dependent dehydrogenase (short-subunit alcohol dehydrogenase family)